MLFERFDVILGCPGNERHIATVAGGVCAEARRAPGEFIVAALLVRSTALACNGDSLTGTGVPPAGEYRIIYVVGGQVTSVGAARWTE